MVNRLVLVCAFLLVAAASPGLAREEPQVVEMDAVGSSPVSFAAAEEEALRSAVEGVIEDVAQGRRATLDARVIRDAMLARTRDYIVEHEVSDRKRGPAGEYRVSVRAVVAKAEIEEDARALRKLIVTMGPPRFVVVVRKAPEAASGSAVWVEGAVEESLRTGDYRALLSKITRGEEASGTAAVDPTAASAARWLAEQAGVGYAMEVTVAEAVTVDDAEAGEGMQTTTVELRADVFASDADEPLATKGASARVSSPYGDGLRRACSAAAEDLLEGLFDPVFADWMAQIETGWPVTVRVVGADRSTVSGLAEEVRGMPEAREVRVEEVPDGDGVAIRAVGRLTAAQIVERIPEWTDGLEPSLENPRTVLARPPEPEEPEQDWTETGPAAGWTARSESSGPRSGTTGRWSGLTYAIPAAILGGCMLVGIIVAAIVAGRK